MSTQRTVNSKRRKEAERAALKLREQYQAKKRQELETKHRNISEKSAQWNEQILPRWAELHESKQVGDLCMKGIPPSIRGKVWPLLIGNNLKITFELFQNLVALAELSTSEHELERKASTPKTKSKRAELSEADEGNAGGEVEEDDSVRESRLDSAAGERIASLDHVMEREWQQLRRKITNEGLGLRREAAAGEAAGDNNEEDEEATNVSREMEREWEQLKRKITNEGLNRPMYDTFESQRHGASSLMKEMRVPSPSLQNSPRTGDEDEREEESLHGESLGIDLALSNSAAEPVIVTKTRADSDPGSLSVVLTSPNIVSSTLVAAAAAGSLPGNGDGDQAVVTPSYKSSSTGPESFLGSPSPDVRRTKHSMDYLVQAGLVAGTPTPQARSHVQNTTHVEDDQPRGVTWSPEVSPSHDTAGRPGLSDSNPDEIIDSIGITGTSLVGDYDDAVELEGNDSSFQMDDSDQVNIEAEENVTDDIDLLEEQFGTNGSDSIGNTPIRRRGTVATMESTSGNDVDIEETHRERLRSSVVAQRHRSLGSVIGSADMQRLQHEILPDSVPTTAVHASESAKLSSEKSGGAHHGTGLKRVTSLDALSVTSSRGSTRTLMQAALAGPSSGHAHPHAHAERFERQESAPTASGASDGNNNLLVDSSSVVVGQSYGGPDRASMKTPPPLGPPTTTNLSAPRTGDSKSSKSPAPESPVSRRHTIKLIEFDIPRTFPTLAFFHDGGPLHVGLVRVLKAYACYRADVGYVQGMSYIVSMLLLYMDELQAFQCLTNLLSRRGNLDFYRLKKFAIDAFVLCFDFFFKQHLPLLYMHMKGEGVTSEMYLMDWNLSLFSKALPLEVAARLWDMYLFEGEVFVTRAALGILRMYAPKLCTLSMEEIMSFLINLPPNVDADILLANIDQIRISKRRYEEMRTKMTAELHSRVNGAKADAGQSHHHTPNQHASEGGKTSAFRGIRRALRATFLGSSTSKDGHADSTPSAPDSSTLSSSNHGSRSVISDINASSTHNGDSNSLSNQRSDGGSGNDGNWRDVGDEPAAESSQQSLGPGRTSGRESGTTQNVDQSSVDVRGMNMNANDMIHPPSGSRRRNSANEVQNASHSPRAGQQPNAGQSSDCTIA